MFVHDEGEITDVYEVSYLDKPCRPMPLCLLLPYPYAASPLVPSLLVDPLADEAERASRKASERIRT